ncbi:MAG: hypothetical protein ABSF09_09815 [Candidatus Bathyarchaeia archaeon]
MDPSNLRGEGEQAEILQKVGSGIAEDAIDRIGFQARVWSRKL